MVRGRGSSRPGVSPDGTAEQPWYSGRAFPRRHPGTQPGFGDESIRGENALHVHTKSISVGVPAGTHGRRRAASRPGAAADLVPGDGRELSRRDLGLVLGSVAEPPHQQRVARRHPRQRYRSDRGPRGRKEVVHAAEGGAAAGHEAQVPVRVHADRLRGREGDRARPHLQRHPVSGEHRGRRPS